MHIPIDDILSEDILSHLPACIEFIDKALKNSSRILVHWYAYMQQKVDFTFHSNMSSMAGQSRSASVCIAYLCAAHG